MIKYERIKIMFNKIIEAIEKYDRIIIHRHSNPDGDALGSQIGLKHILKENYPEKEIYTVGDPSKRYGFMEDSATDTITDDMYKGALAFVLDTSAKALVFDDRYSLADMSIKMDHHIFTEKFCDLELIDTSNAKEMKLMFAYTKLERLDGIENWDVSRVKDFSGMF
jgi:phosphoesterase RecJ-like protein